MVWGGRAHKGVSGQKANTGSSSVYEQSRVSGTTPTGSYPEITV